MGSDAVWRIFSSPSIMERLAALSRSPIHQWSFLTSRIELPQHGTDIADQSGIGLPVPVDFMRVDINPHNLGGGRNNGARL